MGQSNVLEVLENASVEARHHIDRAMEVAAGEINRLLTELATASTGRDDVLEQVTVLKAQLAVAERKLEENRVEEAGLREQLAMSAAALQQSQEQASVDAKRIAELEEKVQVSSLWEAKALTAEKKASTLATQLGSLRQGLLSLTEINASSE